MKPRDIYGQFKKKMKSRLSRARSNKMRPVTGVGRCRIRPSQMIVSSSLRLKTTPDDRRENRIFLPCPPSCAYLNCPIVQWVLYLSSPMTQPPRTLALQPGSIIRHSNAHCLALNVEGLADGTLVDHARFPLPTLPELPSSFSATLFSNSIFRRSR